MKAGYLFTCEHAGHRVPARYRALFKPHQRLLASHRGYDPGIFPVARAVSDALGVSMLAHHETRLLVEVNRSLHHPRLFSKISKALPVEERADVLDRYYHPHRARVTAALIDLMDRNDRVVHVGFHSFTPVLDGVVREVDIGLLYDPARASEVEFCRALKQRLTAAAPHLRIRMNQPYRGASDGLTTALRQQWPDRRYAGIELEINQRLLKTNAQRSRIAKLLIGRLTRA